MRAKDIMSTPVVTAHPDTPVKRITELLAEHKIGAIPIVNQSDELVGLITEGDVIRLQTIPDPRLHAIPFMRRKGEHVPALASELMSINVVTRAEDEDVTSIARLMLVMHLKHVPIVSDKRVVGMISRRDILKVLARSDSSIQAELQERLDDEITLLGWFHAEVTDGVVRLTGPDEKDARRLARLIAHSIPGVVSVQFPEEG